MYKNGYLTKEEFESMKAKISDFKSQDNQKRKTLIIKLMNQMFQQLYILQILIYLPNQNKKFIRYFLFSLPAVAVVLGLLGYYYYQNQYEVKCYFGNGEVCNALGDKYKFGENVKTDLQKANEYYEKGCELDNGQSCFILGGHYNWIGLINKATELYQKACNLNTRLACRKLGSDYQFGNGVRRDINKANELYQKACNLDDGFACGYLGLNYEKEMD